MSCYVDSGLLRNVVLIRVMRIVQIRFRELSLKHSAESRVAVAERNIMVIYWWYTVHLQL